METTRALKSFIDQNLSFDELLLLATEVALEFKIDISTNDFKTRSGIMSWCVTNKSKVLWYVNKSKQLRKISQLKKIGEMKMIEKRIQRCGNLYYHVSNCLTQLLGKSADFKDMLEFAKTLYGFGLTMIDLTARRNKGALIAWFCENWTKIDNYIETIKNDQLNREYVNRFNASIVPITDFDVIDDFQFPVLELVQCNSNSTEHQPCIEESMLYSSDNLTHSEPEIKFPRKCKVTLIHNICRK